MSHVAVTWIESVHVDNQPGRHDMCLVEEVYVIRLFC